MIYRPYFENDINFKDAINRPSTVKARNNRSFCFWERGLFERAKFALEITLPEFWHGRIKDFIIWTLFRRGFVGVKYTPEFGYLAQPCSLSGHDVWYQPTKGIISNPAIAGSLKFDIGKDGAILKLTPDYQGIWDVIDRYAAELSSLDNALDMAIINSKFAWFFGAKNKGAATAIKKGFDQIQRGEPLVVYDQKIADDNASHSEPFQYVNFNLKNNYITDQLLADMSTILRNFDAEIGIPTVPYEKKERLVTDEANARQLESVARATVWIDTINESAKDVKAVYPDIDISAKLRDFNLERSEGDELGNNDTSGVV